MKKLREKLNNKQGFTLVELIVVIVIILVLSAVLVPNVLKYIEKANKANCQSEASTILTELEAEYADQYADAIRQNSSFNFSAKYLGNSATASTTYSADPGANAYSYTIENDTTSGEAEITAFSYGNANYYVTWSKAKGWDEVTKRTSADN